MATGDVTGVFIMGSQSYQQHPGVTADLAQLHQRQANLSKQYLAQRGAINQKLYGGQVAIQEVQSETITKLATERLILSRLHETDGTDDSIAINAVVSWLNDPEVNKYSEQRLFIHTKATQRAYFKKCLQSKDMDYWFVVLNDVERGISQRMIGSLTVSYRKAKELGNKWKMKAKPNWDDCANIGIMIGDKSAWGHGYALEAMTAIINHLTGAGVRRFEIGTHCENERMIRLATACGLKKEHEENGFVYMAAVI